MSQEEELTKPDTTPPEELEEPVIELGDRIRLLGGKHDKTTGRVIYRTADELHLMPDGLTNTALEFGLTEDGFDPELGVESVEILSKRKKASLIEILDLNVDQILETFSPSGEPVSTYTIVKIIPEEDAIVIKNDEEGEVLLRFNYRGIPKDLPFRVIRSRQAPDPVAPETSEDGEDAEQDDQAEADETLEDYTFLDAELDIPAEGIEYLVEIPTADRSYPVIEQKSEAYAELLSLNTLPMQKLSATQKSVKVLIELFFQLRSSILRLSEDGNPKGVTSSSIDFLIDILQSRRLTLSRPIFDVNKVLYHDMEKSEMKSINDINLNLVFKNFDENVIASTRYLNESISNSKFVPFLNEYLKTYAASWISNGRSANAVLGGQASEIAFQRDEEGFRKSAPDLKTSTIPGYPSNLPLPKKGNVSSEMVSNVAMSMVRGLKATITKRQLLQPGEEAAVLGYVLFPLAYANSLSLARNESLIQDVEAGLTEMKTIKQILQIAGDVSDAVSPSHPTLIGIEGGTIGNIALEDYLKFLGLKAEGMGDIWPLQTILGMKENEWTLEQQAVLIKIIRATHAQIVSEIVRQRELLEQLVSQPPAVQGIQLTPDGPAMIQKLSGEKYLLDIQTLIKEQMPAYANSDAALVGLVIRQHPEMAFAQLADQPATLTRERMRYARQEYLTAIRSNQLIKKKATDEGEHPIPVHCSHVKPLQMIRKVKDVNVRLALMSKFLMTFQGLKEDNWVYCNAANGDSHKLLCVHELLQIYQFLRPGDVAVLNKDIQLNYGGGQFQGYYICRNCGQPISELDYDTHLEFDDNGNPMMGRAELVDQDAITMQQIDQVLGPAGNMDTPPIEFDTEQKRFIFTTTKVLADRLHASLEKADYLQVVMRTYSFLQMLPSKERYTKDLEVAQAKSTGKKAVGIDYFIYYNRLFIGAVGAYLLICIQTKKPDIVLQGNPGCRVLGGQPLEEKGTSGIECIVTAIASANTMDIPPWSLARFQDDKVITISVNQVLQSALKDPTVLQDLAQKRDWKRKVLGAEGGQGRPDEIIPSNFAPIPYTMDASDFVEKVIVDEAATVEDRAELWIRQGNALAKKNTMPMPIVFSEASCCISPISTIDRFWKSSQDSLPSFSMRNGIVSPPRITRTEPTMKPSQIVRALPDAPEDSYYLLFLKVCFDGERKGYPHEFGLTHHCMWCGLKLTDVDQGLQAVKNQGIEVTKETFEDLLNETHHVNSFISNLRFEIPSQLNTWASLTSMDPEPASGYREVMLKTQEALLTLAPDANEIEVARALSQFSRFAEEMESNCKSYFSSQQQHQILDSIASNGAESIVRFLQTYCIVPLQQFVSNYTPTAHVPKAWDLAAQHQEDVLKILGQHRSYLIDLKTMPMTAWLKSKIETFILQAQSILKTVNSLRPLQLPGRAQTYEYLLKFCFYAPLANFVDPGDGPSSELGQDILIPAKIISKMINHFNKEGFKFTPEQIREMIAKRNEAEKANILSSLSGLGKAGKEIEMIKMRLGIGKWAVGGTKAIYAYDKERYDVERDERAQAGIIDFPGYGPEGPRAGQPKTDALGYDMTMGQEEGYIGDDQLGDIMGFDEE